MVKSHIRNGGSGNFTDQDLSQGLIDNGPAINSDAAISDNTDVFDAGGTNGVFDLSGVPFGPALNFGAGSLYGSDGSASFNYETYGFQHTSGTIAASNEANSDPVLVVTIDGGTFASGVVTQSTGGLPIASSYDGFFGFGDSNIDSGYFLSTPISTDSTIQSLYEAAVADVGGLPTTIGSSMNSVLLAESIDQTAIPIGESGGTNYAASGATITEALSGSQAPSIVNQIDTYLSSVDDKADPNALYLLSGGGNDVKEAEVLYPSSETDEINYMQSEANSFALAIEDLHADGAQHILIDDFSGPGILPATFNTTLWADLDSAGTPFLVVDDIGVIEGILQNTKAYNAANGTDILYTNAPPAGPFTASNPYNPDNGGAVINPDPSVISNSWSLFGTTADQQSNATTEYLWADDEHLAGAGQAAEAAYTENLINTGVPTVGETLTANSYLATGLTTDTVPSGITFQWQEQTPGGTWQNISGATGSTYTIQNSDIGSALRVEAFYESNSAVSASTEDVACYCKRTMIQTDRGEVPVEDLAIGDMVMTTSGSARPIKWIGRRKVAARFADRSMAWPVRIKAGALGDNVPSRDLLLSPDHAVLIDGILIQAGALVNGSSIVRESDVPETFTYYHVELDAHSLILAENTAAETFVDNIDRMGFDNWAEHEALYPDGNMISEMPYPRAKAYRQVPRVIRERLAERGALLYGISAQAAA